MALKFKKPLYICHPVWYNCFMSENKILEVKGLTVLIKDRFLLKNVNFSMNSGECYGLIGDDKSGKTSLLKAITGSLPISSGNVIIERKDIMQDNSVLNDVAICLDPPMFFKYQSVYENFKYLCSLNDDVNKEQIIKVLNKFNLAHKMRTKVLFLSYYEKKLMALALAFLTKTKLLLLDEPFKALPPDSADEIKSYIEEIRAQGTSIIISSRNLETIEDICEKFIFMENRGIREVLTNTQCKKFDTNKTYAFLSVKYPHYTGKLVIDNFDLKVKLLGNKVLFEADEDTVSDIVKFITDKKIAIYKAGYLSKKSEKIFANLTPYYKEDES